VKVIILGDGLLGSELRKQTGWDFVSRKSHGWDFANELEYYFNYIRYNEYDVVINCIANTNTYGGHEKEHKEINGDRVQDLVDFCNETKKKLVHISTDYLYVGSVSDAKETDDLYPIDSYYGHSKNLGDLFVESSCNNFLLIRTSFKPTPFPYPTAIDQVGNFDYVDVISELIVKLIRKNAKGVFNVGTEKKTMLELAVKTNPDVYFAASTNLKMPKDISMNISKMNKLLGVV
jgi:dTDP-4-dehydrorhamnose reductase